MGNSNMGSRPIVFVLSSAIVAVAETWWIKTHDKNESFFSQNEVSRTGYWSEAVQKWGYFMLNKNIEQLKTIDTNCAKDIWIISKVCVCFLLTVQLF